MEFAIDHMKNLRGILERKMLEEFPRGFKKSFSGYKFFVSAADSPALVTKGKKSRHKIISSGYNEALLTVEIEILLDAQKELESQSGSRENEDELNNMADSLAEFLMSKSMIELEPDLKLAVETPIEIEYGMREGGTRAATLTASYNKRYLREA